ncbi:hypothetical protein V1506DRAFT_542836, partial [Lipomyces tetrasporus]
LQPLHSSSFFFHPRRHSFHQRYYQDIQELNANLARPYARGHDFGRTAAEIRNRLSGELGVVQATEYASVVHVRWCGQGFVWLLCFVFLWLLLSCFVFHIRQVVHEVGSRLKYTKGSSSHRIEQKRKQNKSNI